MRKLLLITSAALALISAPAFAGGITAFVTAGQAQTLILEKKTFALPSYTTAAGATIKDVKIGWEAAGTLNAETTNVRTRTVVVIHAANRGPRTSTWLASFDIKLLLFRPPTPAGALRFRASRQSAGLSFRPCNFNRVS